MHVWLGAMGLVVGAVTAAFSATWALRRARGEQALTGRSRCDACARPLGYSETVPIIGHIMVGGRCRTCEAPVDRFHLWAEAGGALLLAIILLLRPWPLSGLEGLLAILLWALALVDIKTLTLPNIAVVMSAVIAGALAFIAGDLWQNLIVAIMIGAGMRGLAYLMKRRRGRTMLGAGDIKLVMALGLWLGPDMSLALALGSALALVQIGLGLRFSQSQAQNGGGVGAPIAFGPALMAGSLVVGLGIRPWFSLVVT